MAKNIYPVVDKGVKVENEWTWTTKVNVATALLDYGNQRLVAEASGVPYETINGWKSEDWWTNLNQEILTSRRTLMGNKLGTIVDKALGALEDRLVNGDYILNNKTGEIIRKKVTAKDAIMIADRLITQKLKIEELQTKRPETTESVPELLKNLANEFSKFHNRMNKTDVIDVEVKEI